MKINWFTLIAQVINFIILMWLLKRYLYKPILKAIDERENKIKAQLNDAEAKKAEAKKERDEFTKKNEKFDKQKEMLLQKVIEENNTEAIKLKDQTRKEVNTLKNKLEKSLLEEHESQHLEIARKIQQEVFNLTKKTLLDLSSMSLEDQIVNTFIKRIKELKKVEKEHIKTPLDTGDNPILIQSAFDLSVKQKSMIKKAVNDLKIDKKEFQFKTTALLVGGLELSANGYKISWTISEYIKSLEKVIGSAADNNPLTISKNR